MSDLFMTILAMTAWSTLIALLSFAISRKTSRSPEFWLGAIALCFAPFIVGGLWLTLRPETIPYVVIDRVAPAMSAAAGPAANFPGVMTLMMWAYSLIAVAAVGLTLGRFVRLARLAPSIDGVASVPPDIPPSALSWPARKILMPEGLDTQSVRALLAHERAHMERLDPELTLGLCLLGNILWINRPLIALIGAWRDAIELRADRAALHGADAPERRAYAQTLLTAIAVQSKRHGRARPCPSAALIPNQKRRTEMRLQSILSPKAARKSPLKVFALGLGAAMLTGAGTLGVASAAQSSDRDAMPIKRMPPVYPANCESPSELTKINRETNTVTIEGYANLKFDVDPSGVPQNINITKSTAECFEQPSIDAVAQWRYEPKLSGGNAVWRRGVENRVAYRQLLEFKGDVKISPDGEDPLIIQADEMNHKYETGDE